MTSRDKLAKASFVQTVETFFCIYFHFLFFVSSDSFDRGARKEGYEPAHRGACLGI